VKVYDEGSVNSKQMMTITMLVVMLMSSLCRMHHRHAPLFHRKLRPCEHCWHSNPNWTPICYLFLFLALSFLSTV